MTKRGLRRRRTKKDLLASAYHEAGHAVAAMMSGLDIVKVTIIRDERSDGCCIYADADPEIAELWDCGAREDPRVVEWAEATIVTSFAGGIAQRRFAPNSDWEHGRTGTYELPGFGEVLGSGSDLSNVTRRIDDMGYREAAADDYFKKLEARAEALLETHWSKVEELAAELLKHKTLWSDDLHQLLFGKSCPSRSGSHVTDEALSLDG